MNDLISRQAAIDALCSECQGQCIPCDSYPCREVEAINALPSAQPETAKRIVGKLRDGRPLWYQCDMCYEPVDALDNYCCGCGRRLIDEWLD